LQPTCFVSWKKKNRRTFEIDVRDGFDDAFIYEASDDYLYQPGPLYCYNFFSAISSGLVLLVSFFHGLK